MEGKLMKLKLENGISLDGVSLVGVKGFEVKDLNDPNKIVELSLKMICSIKKEEHPVAIDRKDFCKLLIDGE